MKLATIFKITNDLNGKVYVGYSSSVEEYMNLLFSNPDPGSTLGQAIIEDGSQNFTYQVLQEVPPEDSRTCKGLAIQEYRSHEPLYGYNQPRDRTVPSISLIYESTRLKLEPLIEDLKDHFLQNPEAWTTRKDLTNLFEIPYPTLLQCLGVLLNEKFIVGEHVPHKKLLTWRYRMTKK